MNKIKVLIVDDIVSIREKFQRILSQDLQIEVVGLASSGSEAVLMADAHEPHIILMDIEMENKLAGIKAAQQICEKDPTIKIIILTVHEDDEIVYSAFQTGIVDYVLKSAKPEEIIDAVIAAHNDISPIRPVIAEKIRREFQRMRKSENSMMYVLHILSQLTSSEVALLDLIAQGKSRNEIAKIRCVEMSTIKTQINTLLKKFGKSNTKEVAKIINDLNLLEVLKSR